MKEVTVAMPRWGMSMEAGVVVEWRIAPGDQVEEGDVLACVETEKTEVEFESPVGGVIVELMVQEGVEVPVGAELVRLAQDV